MPEVLRRPLTSSEQLREPLKRLEFEIETARQALAVIPIAPDYRHSERHGVGIQAFED